MALSEISKAQRTLKIETRNADNIRHQLDTPEGRRPEHIARIAAKLPGIQARIEKAEAVIASAKS